MNNLLRPRIWQSFLASSGVGPCDVPFRYASEPIPRYRGTVARWHTHLRGLATAIHEVSGPVEKLLFRPSVARCKPYANGGGSPKGGSPKDKPGTRPKGGSPKDNFDFETME